jgi:hypothetical protein
LLYRFSQLTGILPARSWEFGNSSSEFFGFFGRILPDAEHVWRGPWCTAGGIGELRIMDRAGEEADARLKEGGIDAVGIHVGMRACGSKPPGLPSL